MDTTTATMASSPSSNLMAPIALNHVAHPSESCFGAQRSLKIFNYRCDRNIAYLSSRAQNHFHSTFGNLVSDRNSVWDSDQIGILELHPGPLVAIIEDYVKPSGFQA